MKALVSLLISISSAAMAQSGTDIQTLDISAVGDSADMARSVPHVFAPALTGGGNPCIVSIVGGMSIAGFGGTVGAAYVDHECNVRQSLATVGPLLTGLPESSIILKSIACQSEILWDSLELAAMDADNPSVGCINERPKDPHKVTVVRQPEDLPKSYSEAAETARTARLPRVPAPVPPEGGVGGYRDSRGSNK